ncbi:TrmH family RNA methyltransferase [Peterkaempfera sp. SMS 1(5)a]|uniref:TrmH family RNA methyltransferase n=1 Tax=Peterkaempfera podocarpi TaxID=3232308 RepID=UPI00366FE411
MNSSTSTTPPGGRPDTSRPDTTAPGPVGPGGGEGHDGEAHDGEQYDEAFGREVGVGPHPLPWPQGDHYDPELLAHGDRRNVVDRYRYWTQEAVVADLDTRRHPFHVAVENWGHDFNIGSVVRTANAFLAEQIHIVGRRRWNRRGAMVTDRYQHVRHHGDVSSLAEFAAARDLPIIGIDNLPGAVPLETTELPRRCILLFGQEGPGLTEEAWKHASLVCSIAQFGSTRSINAGAAAAVAMHSWIRTHAEIPGE